MTWNEALSCLRADRADPSGAFVMVRCAISCYIDIAGEGEIDA